MRSPAAIAPPAIDERAVDARGVRMTRDELIAQTRRLIDEGERIDANPSRVALNTWLAGSDALLSAAWGSMDRYHLAWLEVGRIAQPLRGRTLDAAEEANEVRAVVAAKSAVLRTSLDAVERLGMPFLGESKQRPAAERAGLPDHLHEAPHGLGGGARALNDAVRAAREAAETHADHPLNRPRTPRSEESSGR